jgi:hypothetical protein
MVARPWNGRRAIQYGDRVMSWQKWGLPSRRQGRQIPRRIP